MQAQLDAFVAEDAERAFSFASLPIRAQFGDASTFMTIVRNGYPKVVRPAKVSFVRAQTEGTESAAAGVATTARQNVQLRDGEGRLWMATYALERQASTGWRINGCVVVVHSGKSLT